MASRKTCFVIIGYGPKRDPEKKGRIIDLDKTFENLIKPVFDELKIKCFRAKEIRHSGNIDIPMYEWIFKADIVIADVSTLNANALYELGVRHALRPNTTIVISEDQTKYPFDLNHTMISLYEHLGNDIGVSEANRFKSELKDLVKSVLKSKKNDSPVYTYLPGLQPPYFNTEEIKLITEKPKNQVSLSELIIDAENAKNREEFQVAILIYIECLKFDPQNVFLIQRLALVTYKNAKPNPKQALLDAKKILDALNPEETTDTETLGLSGAIHKRLFEITKSIKYLNAAIKYYNKGYLLAEDYYNGINYAYLLTQKASLEADQIQIISLFTQSQQIRIEIVEICKSIIKQKTFKDRGDKEWVYQTLAQAYLGLDKKEELKLILNQIYKLSRGEFDIKTFEQHNSKLMEYISIIKRNITIVSKKTLIK